MTRLRWVVAQVLREHPNAPDVMAGGIALLMLARLFSIPL